MFFVCRLEVLIEKVVAIGFGHHDTGDRKAHSLDRNNHSYSCFPTVDNSPLSPILPVANQLANNEKNYLSTGAVFGPSRVVQDVVLFV